MKIGIIGSGAWGTSLANVLLDNGNDVLIYSRNEAIKQEINERKTNSKYFENIVLNNNIKATSSLKETLSFSDVLVFCVPTKSYREVLKSCLPFLDKKYHIVSTAKGFEKGSFKRMSEIIREEIPSSNRYQVVTLIGPSLADDVILKHLTLLSAVSLDEEEAKFVQKLFSNEYFRVYTQNDEIGSELGASLKNAIAIASGILEGLGMGDNARAALVTRGLQEIIRFGEHFNGQFKTFMGLTGIGDLIVTCNSIHSRNFSFGCQIGKHNDAKVVLENNQKTVEGIQTIKSVYLKAKEENIYMPIIEALYHVIFEYSSPKEEINSLMTRELKKE